MYEYTVENPAPPPPSLRSSILYTREYWMIYRGPDFLAVAWFASSSSPSPSSLVMQQVVALSRSSCLSPVELTDRGGGWGRSQIIRQREYQVIYKSFNTLCFTPNRCLDKLLSCFRLVVQYLCESISLSSVVLPVLCFSSRQANLFKTDRSRETWERIWRGWSLDFPLNILPRFFLFGAVQYTVRKS